MRDRTVSVRRGAAAGVVIGGCAVAFAADEGWRVAATTAAVIAAALVVAIAIVRYGQRDA